MSCVRYSERTAKGLLPSLYGLAVTCLLLVLYINTGIVCQDEEPTDAPPPRPVSIADLYNTTSCVEPPLTCPHRRIQFFLYTRATQHQPELLDTLRAASLRDSRFNADHPTKVVIHGFGGGRNLAPSTDIRDAYFKHGEYNILIVDYGSLVKQPCLSQIEWSPRFCAQCIAQLVGYLNKHPQGTAPDNLHLIGYSVGAHIAGLVANYLTDGKLGRITGLDPTIIFYMGQNKSRDLDPSDAHFIDVIHTGAGILGQWGPNGHVDFYVNGGSSQPGCRSSTLLKTLSCDHTKVTPYFIESINSEAGFWAAPCPNQFMFFLGLCNARDNEYIPMGEHAPRRARGLYYLTTNAKKPYAKGFPGKSVRLTQQRGNDLGPNTRNRKRSNTNQNNNNQNNNNQNDNNKKNNNGNYTRARSSRRPTVNMRDAIK